MQAALVPAQWKSVGCEMVVLYGCPWPESPRHQEDPLMPKEDIAAPPLRLYFDNRTMDVRDMATVIKLLSDFFGERLEIVSVEHWECPTKETDKQ